MSVEVHPHRPLARKLIACHEVRQIGSLTSLAGLIEKVTAYADAGHFRSTLYASLSSGQGDHCIQIQIVYLDSTGEEISRLTSTPRTMNVGEDPLAIRGLPIPMTVKQKGRGVIEFLLVIDGHASETLEIPVR